MHLVKPQTAQYVCRHCHREIYLKLHVGDVFKCYKCSGDVKIHTHEFAKHLPKLFVFTVIAALLSGFFVEKHICRNSSVNLVLVALHFFKNRLPETLQADENTIQKEKP